jgi:hypothetical protein
MTKPEQRRIDNMFFPPITAVEWTARRFKRMALYAKGEDAARVQRHVS